MRLHVSDGSEKALIVEKLQLCMCPNSWILFTLYDTRGTGLFLEYIRTLRNRPHLPFAAIQGAEKWYCNHSPCQEMIRNQMIFAALRFEIRRLGCKTWKTLKAIWKLMRQTPVRHIIGEPGEASSKTFMPVPSNTLWRECL